MGLDLDPTHGQTPLDPDEREGLRITTITTRGELDEFEQLGVEKAIEWTRSRRLSREEILTEAFITSLHIRMFGDIWTWAGHFRTTNKNIGVDKSEIREELRKLLDDCSHWIDHTVFPGDEIAIRLSHRLVLIHPFPNGNGRHSRLMADILVSHGLGGLPFSWGSIQRGPGQATREMYLQALRRADEGDYEPIIAFARM